MINRFLAAKHWQVFIITFGIPILLQLFLMASLFLNISNSLSPDPLQFLRYFRLFPLLMVLSYGGLYLWMWAVGTGLQDKLPETVKMKIGRFKWSIIIPIIYFTILSIIIVVTTNIVINDANFLERDVSFIPPFLFLFLLFHLLSIACIFYSFFFTAKTYKSVELQKEATFSDCMGEFFLIWFFPIGIWFLQPKINKMVKKTEMPPPFHLPVS